MDLIKVLVCEDEKLIAKRLIRFIDESFTTPYQLKEVNHLSEAMTYIEAHSIDLLFLDLNLHGKDGFKILQQFCALPFHTIIVSAYIDRAIEAFEYGVLDFVGKPFTKNRIKKGIDRFQFDQRAPHQHLKHIVVKNNRTIEFIAVKDILYIQAASIYSELVLINGTIKIYDKPLNQLLKLLPSSFLRVHKSYVTSINHIKGIRKRGTNAYEALLSTELSIPISRSVRKTLIKHFKEV